MSEPEAPAAVRKIIDALARHSLAQCEQWGIPKEDYYRAFLEEQRLHPKVSYWELFELAFRRLEKERKK